MQPTKSFCLNRVFLQIEMKLYHDEHKNIIAKIPYGCNLSPLTVSTNSFPTMFINDESIISSDRQYFGPIHLQKIAIRLLNRYGNVVDLNLLDFSFTLEMNVLYEL